MIAVIFLLSIFLHGLALANYILRKDVALLKILAAFLFGSIFCISAIYWISCITKSLNTTLIIYGFISAILVLFFKKAYVGGLVAVKKLSVKQILGIFSLFAFSLWLFTKTFGYDSTHGLFLIASNVYMDFGAHIPFIRSFSMGNNFPGEVPFFQHSGLLYYFLFDFYTAILEHLGMRIDIAYNILSSISLTTVCMLIYYSGATFFKKRSIGILSVIFFLFSSNLSFITFFQRNGISFHALTAWWHANFYLEGQPLIFNKAIPVAQFLNLDPLVNQRHLVFGLGFFLFVIFFIFLQQKKQLTKPFLYTTGIAVGLFAFWHTMLLLAIFMIMPMGWLFYKNRRKDIGIITALAIGVSLPQLFLIKLHSANFITLHPGFIIDTMLSVQNFIYFWVINVGFLLPLCIIGFLVSSKEQKKFFFLVAPLFVVPNIFHISSRFPFDDHKYFIAWILFMNMFAAFALTTIAPKTYALKYGAVILTVCMVLSGCISIMVIKNDVLATIPDYPNSSLLRNAMKILPSSATILTNGEIYDPITLIGKKTYVGRVQYIYVYGGNPSPRLVQQKEILQPTSEQDMINAVKQAHIQYIVLYKNRYAKNEIQYNATFLNKRFIKIYEDAQGVIYKI